MSYSPTLGRFLEQDPERYTDSLNLYQAYRSNPLAFVDPMGTDSRAATQPTVNPLDKDKEDAGTSTNGPPGVNCLIWACNTSMGGRDAGFLAFGNDTKLQDAVTANGYQALIDAWEKILKDKNLGYRTDKAECPCGEHLVAMYGRVTKGNWLGFGAGQFDFHFTTQAPDGSWTGKDGWPGGLQSFPAGSDMTKQSFSGFNTTFLGYYCIKGPARNSAADINK